MWAPWLRSSSRPAQPPSKQRSRTFSCSSFKDIQYICQEEPEYRFDSTPNTPRSPSIFHRARVSASVLRAWARLAQFTLFDGADNRILLYYTSLRVVQKTFEDCRTVRSILRGFRVSIDERDLSMDSRFLDELQEILGRKDLTPPCVFIGGRYIGGAEEIKQLHECGELKRLIERLPKVESITCGKCAGHGFVLCEQCDGSHKIYIENCGFKICTDCNINGIVRCSTCSSVRLRSTISQH